MIWLVYSISLSSMWSHLSSPLLRCSLPSRKIKWRCWIILINFLYLASSELPPSKTFELHFSLSTQPETLENNALPSFVVLGIFCSRVLEYARSYMNQLVWPQQTYYTLPTYTTDHSSGHGHQSSQFICLGFTPWLLECFGFRCWGAISSRSGHRPHMLAAWREFSMCLLLLPATHWLGLGFNHGLSLSPATRWGQVHVHTSRSKSIHHTQTWTQIQAYTSSQPSTALSHFLPMCMCFFMLLVLIMEVIA